MLKGQCIIHLIIALSTCLMLGGLLVPGYIMFSIPIEADTGKNFRLYLGVWYGVACFDSNCDVFFSGEVTQKAVKWNIKADIRWEKIPFVDMWKAFAALITTAHGLCCIAAFVFTKRTCCNHNTSSPERAELVVISFLLGLNVCLTFVSLILYFDQYPLALPSTAKQEFQVALLLSSLGSAGALTASMLCLILVFKNTPSRQQSSSSHNNQGETHIPLASIDMASTNQTDPNSLQNADTHLTNCQSSDSITTATSGIYQLPLQPQDDHHKLEPSAPPPPWWWNP